MADDNNKDDDLLRRARELNEKVEQRQADGGDDRSAVARAIYDSPTLNRVSHALRWLGPIGWGIRWIGRWLKWLIIDPVDGKPIVHAAVAARCHQRALPGSGSHGTLGRLFLRHCI